MPHTAFLGPGGEQWPSVTEVLGIVAKPFLMDWYKREVYKSGLAGWQKCEKIYEDGCNFGTEAHNALETWNLAHPVAEMIYDQFLPHVYEFIAQEVKVVNNKYRYHGTADAIVRMEGEQGLWVLDWKTSNTTTDWYTVQMAAYAAAWNEEHPDQMIDQAICVHYDKKLKTPKLKVTKYYGLKQYFKAFVACREVLDFDRATGPWRENARPRTEILKVGPLSNSAEAKE